MRARFRFGVSVCLALAFAVAARGRAADNTSENTSTSAGLAAAAASDRWALTPAGKFAVDDNGNAQFTMRLLVPPGPSAAEPALTLAYSSQRQRDRLGEGWRLQGGDAGGLALHVQAARMPPGRYVLELDGEPAGAAAKPVDRYRFEVVPDG